MHEQPTEHPIRWTDGLPGMDPPRLPVKKPGPKGLARYKPRPGSKGGRILTVAVAAVARYRDEGRVNLGSREVGYVLTREGFTHGDVPYIEGIVERARRAGHIAMEAISDGRTSSDGPWTVETPEEIADQLGEWIGEAQLDRQAGQRYRVEIWAEAAAWIPRLVPVCAEYGVRVYSGSGSVPLKAVHDAAVRTIARGRRSSAPSSTGSATST